MPKETQTEGVKEPLISVNGEDEHNILKDPVVRKCLEHASSLCSDPDAVEFATPDDLFAGDYGVIESETPSTFIGAELGNRFRVTAYIQSGQFGRGWRAQVINTKQEYCDVFLKTLRSPQDTLGGHRDAHNRMVRREIMVFSQNRFARLPLHQNVAITALLYGSVTNLRGSRDNMFFFVSPHLCECGELFEYLCLRKPPYARNFEEPYARMIFHQLASGVKFLHDNGVTHRDLKLENLVLDSTFTLKIMDFGSAKWDDEAIVTRLNGEDVVVASTIIGTPCMQPPELDPTRRRYYRPRAFDVWSIGVILFFLVAMEEMVIRGLNFDLFRLINTNHRDYRDLLRSTLGDDGVPLNTAFWEYLYEVSARISPELKHLLNSIFNIRPTDRATVEDVLAHPWLAGEYPSQEEYVIEMESRPTQATERDRFLDIPPGMVLEDIHDGVIEACLTLSDADTEEEQRVQVQEHISMDLDNAKFTIGTPTFFTVEVLANSQGVPVIRCSWLRGSLQQWFTFFFGLQRYLQGRAAEVV